MVLGVSNQQIFVSNDFLIQPHLTQQQSGLE